MTTAGPAAPAAAPPRGTAVPLPGLDAVTLWLIVVAAMVFAMVAIGGVTRLTQSGLSIVDWNPIMGAIPPLDEAQWRAVFEAYRQSPEYQQINRGMSLDEFKGIFWWEYVHRLWGRLIGLAYALPFLWFALAGRVRGRFAWGLAGLLALGGLQGVLGWLMVKSGLVDVPRVSPYRLTAHLGLAVLIYLLILWIVLRRTLAPEPGAAHLARPAVAVFVLALATMVSGGFVAGTKAGLTYNTFPLMDGRLVPDGLFALAPPWRNFFENVTLVQFDHRVLATVTAAAVLALAVAALRRPLPPRARAAVLAALAATLAQFALGVATLLAAVPVALGTLHQAGAVVVASALLWLVHETRARA